MLVGECKGGAQQSSWTQTLEPQQVPGPFPEPQGHPSLSLTDSPKAPGAPQAPLPREPSALAKQLLPSLQGTSCTQVWLPTSWAGTSPFSEAWAGVRVSEQSPTTPAGSMVRGWWGWWEGPSSGQVRRRARRGSEQRWSPGTPPVSGPALGTGVPGQTRGLGHALWVQRSLDKYRMRSVLRKGTGAGGERAGAREETTQKRRESPPGPAGLTEGHSRQRAQPEHRLWGRTGQQRVTREP